MISVSGKNWEKQKVNKNLVEKVKQDYGLGDVLSQLIISRNYDASEIYSINNNQKLINIFKVFKPDMRVIGSDWQGKIIVGSEYSGEIIFYERKDENSTTRTLENYVNRRHM